MWDLDALPASLAVLGGGAIGCELVANTPPVDQLPIYQTLAGSRLPPPDKARALVTAYNEAVEHVADDGFHPSTEGHARIAAVFAAALCDPESGHPAHVGLDAHAFRPDPAGL